MVRTSIVPLYQQLSETVKQQIMNGQFQEDDQLPTEAEFSEQFGVSRITVRKAIELLVDDGIVVRKQGIGTFVAGKRLNRVMKNQVISFTEMSRMDGHEPSAELISVGWIMPNASLMKHLQVDEKEQILRIVRLRKNDGEIVLIEENFYPKKLSFLLEENLLGSTYEIFRKHNLNPTYSVKTVDICYANEEEARQLGVAKNQALILHKDKVMDQNREIIHFCKQRINPQRYRLTIVI